MLVVARIAWVASRNLQHGALATIILSAVLLLVSAPVATWLYRTRTAD